jgi:hypothetical protein
MNFYVSITTIRKYKSALEILLGSLPKEWKNKYILIYENEENNDYKIFEDGHIEVTIQNNIFDYGNWVGIGFLLELGVLPYDSWFLFIHDTCRFIGDKSYSKTMNILEKLHETDIDLLWLGIYGQCNICLIREPAITYGYNIYKNIHTMTKKEAIKYEWNDSHPLSPKNFKINHQCIDIPSLHLGKRAVYSEVQRDVLLYQSIQMEKYYVNLHQIGDKREHPCIP